MSEPFIGEIRMFAGNFAPVGHAFCNGQLLQVSQNEALFSLLGTIYGGDGRTTFGLPDLRGRSPIHKGAGPGLTNRNIGSSGGAETVSMTTAHLPAHSHNFQATNATANTNVPTGNELARAVPDVYTDGGDLVNLNANAISSTGGGGAHAIMMPFAVIHFIIALLGIFPSQN